MGTFILQILIAIGCGALLGIEREQRSKYAGFRTYILVCLGGCLAMVLARNIFQEYNAGDPSRIPAAVIQGIGFLGSACIIFNIKDNKISGITTAADVLCIAIVGLLIGNKMYLYGIITSVLLFIINKWFLYISIYLFKNKQDIRKKKNRRKVGR